MARTTDPCAVLRKRVAESEASIKEMEERLPETPPRERPALREKIKKERRILGLLLQLLRQCEREHAASKRPGPKKARPPVKRR